MKRLISILVLTTLVLSICFTGTTGFKTAFADSEVDLNDGKEHYAYVLPFEAQLYSSPGVKNGYNMALNGEMYLIYGEEDGYFKITQTLGFDFVYIESRMVLVDPQFVTFTGEFDEEFPQMLELYPYCSIIGGNILRLEKGQKFAIIGEDIGSMWEYYIVDIGGGVAYFNKNYEHTIE